MRFTHSAKNKYLFISSNIKKRHMRAAMFAIAAIVLITFLSFQGAEYSATSSSQHYSSACTQTALAAEPDTYSSSADVFDVEDTPATASQVQGVFYQSLGTSAQDIATAFAGIPGDAAVTAFSLAEETAEELTSEQLESIESAISDIGAECAFVMVDAQTGQGIQYNSSSLLYGASSAKAWYGLYLAQLADEGSISLEDSVYCYGTDYPTSGTWSDPYCVGALLENTLLYSDNSAYIALRDTYDWDGFTQWLADMDINQNIVLDQSYYPFLTAQSSVQIWANIYEYINSDAENAAWLKSLLSSTEVSFLRDALDESSTAATVFNKAGWDSASSYDWYQAYLDTLCDSGIVQVGGHTYFVSAIANIGEGEENTALLESLIAALF